MSNVAEGLEKGLSGTLTERTITDVFWRRVAESPDKAAILHKPQDKVEFVPFTWKEYGETVERLSAALQKNGLEPGDKAAILSPNRPHWSWADIAILSSGAVTIPVYATLSDVEVQYILNHSDSKALFLSNEHQLSKVIAKKEDIPSKLEFIVMMDGPAPEGDLGVRVIEWESFLKEGEEHLKTSKEDIVSRRQSIEPDALATIVYTSGTTGVPKGAMILHKNIFAVMESMSSLIDFNPDDIALSFLPLSHVYERVGGQFLTIYNGVQFAYAESMEQVAVNLTEVKPTLLNAVPRFYEKAYARIQSQIRQMPATRQAFIKWAISIGKRATRQRVEQNIEPNIIEQIVRAELRIAERLVFRKIRDRFGGRLRMMTSGAAPLSNDVHIFFEAIGIPIVEGYGLTETCAPLACNTPTDIRFKTVGKPLPGLEVKIAKDGELLVKGATVFNGYYKDPDSTAAAFDGEWFKTGDIANIDADGYIQITDRKKDIIITAGGKHIAPQFIENLFKSEPLIAHVLAYGDRRKYLTGLVTLNPEALEKFAVKNKLNYESFEKCSQLPKVRAEIEKIVQEKNRSLAGYQRIKKFIILDREFTIENNDLTPTMKLKRKTVTEKFKSVLDSMYEAEDLEAQEFNS